MQLRYWKAMTNYKFKLCYLHEHFSEYVKTNRRIVVCMAVLGSSSVATWAIWNRFPMVWGAIIASSQVLSVINHYLPYQKRIEEISKMKSGLAPVYSDMEYNWFNVADGSLTEQEINDLIKKFDDRWTNLELMYFTSDALPYKEKLAKRAEGKEIQYFKAKFQLEEK